MVHASHSSLDATQTGIAGLVIVDDHPIVRRGLRQLFDRQEDFSVCGEAGNETEAFDLVEALNPDLLVTDLTLEGRSGLDLIRRIHRYHPGLLILVVSMHEDWLYAQRAIDAGAHGYVMKQHADSDVLDAARTIRQGHLYWGKGARTSDTPRNSNTGSPSPVESLTDREFQVFLLMGQGFTPRHIAEKLSLSVSTVEVYRQRIKEKLAIESSPMLVRYAVRWCKDQPET